MTEMDKGPYIDFDCWQGLMQKAAAALCEHVTTAMQLNKVIVFQSNNIIVMRSSEQYNGNVMYRLFSRHALF